MSEAPARVQPRTELLEAGAGTGKTHAIAGRATMALALGQARIGQILLVTFARAAAEELGERVRSQLHGSVQGLTAALAGGSPTGAPSTDDPPELYAGGPAELTRRRDRLRTALGAFDEATITTIHTFCSQVLRDLGVLADFDPTWTLRESFDALVGEIVEDTYLARYRGTPHPPITPSEAGRYGRAAAYAGPVHTPADTPRATERADFVHSVHTQFRHRKRRGGMLDYDDLQILLQEALTDEITGARACQSLRQRYRLVLVDEFQDTDPVQWDILRTVFHGHVPLVLVGDPKQAIYAFRGGDIDTYLRARSEAGTRSDLAVNRRSDADIVHAVGCLLQDRALGDPQITVTPLRAHHHTPRIRGVPAAMRLRALRSAGLSRGRVPRVNEVRPVVIADLVAQVRGLLAPGVELCPDGGWRRVEPADIAVLVSTNFLAGQVQEGLQAAGVPAVRPVTTSVLDSPAAQDWSRLLQALAQPTHQARLRAAALTVFVGWDGDRLARAEDVDEVSDLIAAWGEVLAGAGIGALFDVMCTRTGLPARVLAGGDGERRLTDLRHITDLLLARESAASTGAVALSAWFTAQLDAHRRRPPGPGTLPAEVTRRLESDAAAVKVMTIHAAKGLGFPIVLLPFLADQASAPDRDPLTVQHGACRVVADASSTALRKERDTAEAGERLRQVYVALTRAASHLVVWWAPSTTTTGSALHSLLFGPPDAPAGHPVPIPDDDTVDARLAALTRISGGAIGGERVAAADVHPAPGLLPLHHRTDEAEPAGHALAARLFTRSLDLRWRRTSYTGLTAEAHDQAPAPSEPEDPGIQDEPDDEQATGASPGPAPTGTAPVLMADLPGGTGFGTLVHAILEDFDPAAPDLAAHLTALTHRQARLGDLSTDQAGTLTQALLAVVHTPLGDLALGRSLAAIPGSDRLNELAFELPLAGGDLTGTSATLADLADLIEAHLPADDPLVSYPAQLRTPELATQDLRGYLTGSLDAVLRVREEDTTPRYLVVDYKTNRLAGPDEELGVGHYLPGPMAEAMIRSHYPLQAVLYQVALHRYLRWRQPGYRPAQHLGGVLYLFVRGMTGPPAGPDGPRTGVFAWRPPPALVEAASDLLAGLAGRR